MATGTIRELAYWTMSGRIGDLKTFGSGWVLSLGLPLGPMMVTTGLLVILMDVGDEQNELEPVRWKREAGARGGAVDVRWACQSIFVVRPRMTNTT
jgi:hypothetical protein